MSLRYTDCKPNSMRSAKDGNDSKFATMNIKRHEADIVRLEDRINELKAWRGSPGKTYETGPQREWKQLFTQWTKKPRDPGTNLRLANFENEHKAMTIESPSGGYAVTTEIARDIERLELKLSPVRRLVKVMQIGTSNLSHFVNTRGCAGCWVSESGSLGVTATPLLRQVAPTQAELYAYPQISEWALDDAFFDAGAWLAEEVAQAFALLEGTAVVSGTGSDQPTGMLNSTPVTTDDSASPLRGAGAYEYIPVTGSPVGITAEDLIDLVYTLNSAYRTNATWVMNSATGGVVHKLKDSTGRFVWDQSLSMG